MRKMGAYLAAGFLSTATILQAAEGQPVLVPANNPPQLADSFAPPQATVAAPVTMPTVAAPPITLAPTENAIMRAGTPISFRMMEEITTKKKAAKVGQRFQLEVSAPVEVNGVVVVPAGTPAWGELTSVRNKGMWGKSGKLEARLLYMRVNGRQIRLTGNFDDKGVTGTAGVVGAVAFVPIAGFFLTGTSAVFPMGGYVNGFVDEDVVLAFKEVAPAPLAVPVAAPPMSVAVAPAPVTAEPVAAIQPAVAPAPVEPKPDSPPPV